MSVSVCNHKCIGKGYMGTVTRTCTQAVFDAVRYNQLDHESFIYERDVKIAFSYMERTRKTREHSDRTNDKYQKWQIYILIIAIYLLQCAIIFLFAILQNTSLLRILEGNLCLSHVVAQTETCSHFLPTIGDT